jgi:hypothetical protein
MDLYEAVKSRRAVRGLALGIARDDWEARQRAAIASRANKSSASVTEG